MPSNTFVFLKGIPYSIVLMLEKGIGRTAKISFKYGNINGKEVEIIRLVREWIKNSGNYGLARLKGLFNILGEFMEPKEFCYWLKGYAELTDSSQLTERQWQVIKEHLSLVFHKITPDHNDDTVDHNDDTVDHNDDVKTLKRVLEMVYDERYPTERSIFFC